LDDELDKARKQLGESQKINTYNKVVNFDNKRKRLYERLEAGVLENISESELNHIIDSLRLHFGASSMERKKAIDFLFDKIIEHFLPGYLRYILYASSEESECGNSSGESCTPFGTRKPGFIFAEMNLNESQVQRLQTYKNRLNKEHGHLKKLMEKFIEIKNCMLNESQKLEQLTDRIRDLITPKQICKYILSIEKTPSISKKIKPNNFWQSNPDEEDSESENETEKINIENYNFNNMASNNQRNPLEELKEEANRVTGA